MKTKFALAALTLGMAAHADAAVYLLTVTGTTQVYSDDAHIFGMTDRLGLFGAPGGLMMGKAFTMTFRIDAGQPWVQTTSSATQSVWSSGINPYYQRGKAITGTFSMNGKTYRDIGLSGPNAASNSATANGVGSESLLSVQNGVAGASNDLFQISTGASANYPGGTVQRWGRAFDGFSTRINVSLDGVSYLVAPADLYAGGGVLKAFDAAAVPGAHFGNGQFAVEGNGTAGSTYSLDISRVTLAAAVPEPAQWALMIGGFGLVGGAMRRRVSARCPGLAG
jgi:hypothetical protein